LIPTAEGYLDTYSSGSGYGNDGYNNKKDTAFDCTYNNNNNNVVAGGGGNVTDGNGNVRTTNL
jgi:hypothetical protein